MNIQKFAFIGELDGEMVGVRVSAHTGDLSKLVIKSPVKAAIEAFAKAFALPVEEPFHGKRYWIAAVPKVAFVASMTAMAKAVAAQQVKALNPVTCPECGCENGNHWACCSAHEEAAQAVASN